MTATASEIARNLAGAGISERVIAESLRLPLPAILDLLGLEKETHPAAEDEVIRAGVRKVAWRTIEVALDILETGNPTNRMRLVSMLLGRMMPMLTSAEPEEMSELRTKMDELMSEVMVDRAPSPA